MRCVKHAHNEGHGRCEGARPQQECESFMKRNQFSSAMLTVTLAVGAAATACSSQSPSDGANQIAKADSVNGGGRYNWWRAERADRQEAFDAYLAANQDDFQSFKNAPLGNLGIPMVMLRLFPELFPEYWGGPNDDFAPVGFAKDPFEPTRVLPLGLGYAGSTPAVPTQAGPVNVHVVALTCI